MIIPKVECVESSGNCGRFSAEPLERGFGITLGNALRRVLFSSLPGAAVNWVKIEGMQHEFSTVPHVKEDTIELLLNVKAMRIRSLSQREGTLNLEVEGARQVCAADIETSADFEIVNPELYLATLDSSKAKLSIEFNVALGKGYVPAASSDGLPIGVIPIDAIFTPVSKVNYTVEPSRLGQEANLEKLILEVWTDGTLSPLEAISQSATILIEQFSSFRELAKTLIEDGAELTWQRLIPPDQYNMSLDQLSLSTHTYNSLRRGGITTLGLLLEKGVGGLASLAGFGAKSREEVQTALESLNLPFVPGTEEKKRKRRSRNSASSGEQGEEKDETSDSRTETE